VWEKCYAAHTQGLYGKYCTARGDTCRDYKQYSDVLTTKTRYMSSSGEQQIFLRKIPSINPLHFFSKIPTYIAAEMVTTLRNEAKE
jgi:hypothetical protein